MRMNMVYDDRKINPRTSHIKDGICRYCGEPTDEYVMLDKTRRDYWHKECKKKIKKIPSLSARECVAEMRDELNNKRKWR